MTTLIRKIILVLASLSLISNAQWKQSNGPENGTITKLYTHNNIIFAISNTFLFKSSDYGATWEQMKNGLPERSVLSFTAHGSNFFVGGSEGAVYRSTDNGKSWTAMLAGPGVKFFAFSSVWRGDTLFIGGYDQDLGGNLYHRIYSTTNFGESWFIISDQTLKSNPWSLISVGSLIVAGTQSQGIYVSSDFGSSWSAKNQGLKPGSVRSLCTIDSFLYAATDSGIFRTVIGAWNWVSADTSLTNYLIFDLFPFGGKIFAAKYEGILVTENHWKEWKYALYKHWTTTFFSFANIGNRLFVGTSRTGVYRSDDSGKTWNPTGAMVKRISINDMASSDSILLACGSDGIYETANEGERWTNLNTDTVDGAYNVGINSSYYFAGNYWGLFRTKRDERKWKPIIFNQNVSFLYIKGDSVYMQTQQGLFFSPNNGETVHLIDSSHFSKYSSISAMIVRDSSMIIASNVGLFVSGDHGKTLVKRSSSIGNEGVIKLLYDDTQFFAVTSTGGIHRTSMSDTAWTKQSNAPGFFDGTSVAVRGRNLFVSGYRGVFYSTNFGETWVNAGNGGTPFYNAFAIEILHNKVFVGLANYGIWYRDISELITAVEHTAAAHPKEYMLAQNYPNPFNPTTRIEYQIPIEGIVTLKIFDMLGRETAELVNEVKGAGSYSAQWNGAPFASGIYFAKLQSRGNSIVKKMILLK